ncbi:hypothetical protein GIB67_042067 [Kingdonia uniflora]|uniref:H(+)-exporting diphosphatase n=1 Tax=Kingdonia uniflora TaxID=39325 RepID=A0A7J7MVU4_9MAGN|nr:hypothetical protein GIB67_042067 [Kingdonia uniflora]
MYGSTSFLFTMYQYVYIFMVAFAVLIFLFLGSVEGFSTKLQPALYLQQGQNVQVHPSKYCLQYYSIARRYHISNFFWLSWDENYNLCKCENYLGGKKRCWEGF